jgi:hypothetical protein
VNSLTKKPQFSWRSWRLGGDFLAVTYLATPDRRVLVLNGKMKPVRRAAVSTDYTDYTDFTERIGLEIAVR